MSKRKNSQQVKTPDTKIREQFSEDAKKLLESLTRQYQVGGYEYFLEFISGEIETEGGKIKYSNKNLSSVQKLITWFDGWGNKFKRYILKPILEGARELLGLNDKYFAQISGKPIPDKARYRALLQWGYDSDKNTVVAGSYLDGVLNAANGIPQRVGALMNQAIGAKMPLAEFRDKFRKVFVGRANGGLLEYQFKRATLDLYQTIDRAANYEYGKSLGLNYAIYSGTLIETSRPFCEERVNKVFSIKEIAAWSELDFEGKPPIYNPFINCGGYNCRHHLSFISDEMAEYLKSKQ